MVQLPWTESQKIVIIRIISFIGTSMSDEKRGAALALIHRITFKSKDELNELMPDILPFMGTNYKEGLMAFSGATDDGRPW